MSNTKQQIEEILPCVSCGINADVADGFGVCTCGNEAKREAIDRLVIEAKIKGINEAHKEILEMAYAYTGEDELSDFCGVDDLSRVAMSWKVSRIKELIEAAKILNLELHGREDCKSCALMEELEEML